MNEFCFTPTFGVIMILILTLRSLLFPSYVRYCNFNVFKAPKDEKLVFAIIVTIDVILTYFLLQLNISSSIKNVIFLFLILFAQVIPQIIINTYRNYYKKN